MAENIKTDLLSEPKTSTVHYSKSPRGSLANKQVTGLSVENVQDSLLRLLPEHEEFVKTNIIEPLCISDEDLFKVQELFDHHMDKGLDKETHHDACVKMYPSYVREVPDGTEKGQFLAVDFSGVNFRVLLVSLGEDGPVTESKNGLIPNRLLNGPGELLFDHIAALIHKFLQSQDLLNTPEPLPLGFTFSFSCHQQAINKAILRHWSKNFHCEGVEGHEIVSMLDEAIKRKGDMNIECDAVINDTVGTLMSGALDDSKCAIGYILGKGTNACYMENLDNVGTWDGDADDPKQVIINTEWRNFGKDGCLNFIQSDYDKDIDTHSKHPGSGTYEKMVAGEFLGELVRQLLQKLSDNDVLFLEHWTPELETRGRFYTKYISEVLSEEDIRFKRTRHVFDDVHLYHASELECRVLHHVCQLVSYRAASLSAIGLACLLNRINKPEVAIAVDGSLFRFHPMLQDILVEKIPQFLKQDKKFWFIPTTDGGGRGSAVVAAVTERFKHR